MADAFVPGQVIYWFSEPVTVVRKARRNQYGQLWTVRRRAQSGKLLTGEPFFFPEREQDIYEHALDLAPNNVLQEIVADFMSFRDAIPQLAGQLGRDQALVRKQFDFQRTQIEGEQGILATELGTGRRKFFTVELGWEDMP